MPDRESATPGSGNVGNHGALAMCREEAGEGGNLPIPNEPGKLLTTMDRTSEAQLFSEEQNGHDPSRRRASRGSLAGGRRDWWWDTGLPGKPTARMARKWPTAGPRIGRSRSGSTTATMTLASAVPAARGSHGSAGFASNVQPLHVGPGGVPLIPRRLSELRPRIAGSVLDHPVQRTLSNPHGRKGWP